MAASEDLREELMDEDDHSVLVYNNTVVNDDELINSQLYSSLVSEAQVSNENPRIYTNRSRSSSRSESLDKDQLAKRRKEESVTTMGANRNNKRQYTGSLAQNALDKGGKDNSKEFKGAKNSDKDNDSNNSINIVNNSANFVNGAGGTAITMLKYDRADKGPFYIHLRQADITQRPKMLIEVGRMLRNCNIKHKLIEYLSRGTWLLTFDQFNEANNMIGNDHIIKQGFSAFVPRERVLRKCVVRDIPIAISKDEFINEVNTYNPGLRVSDMYRFTRRVQGEDGNSTRAETTTVCFTIRSSNIPKHIIIYEARIKVSPFILSVRQCYKCGKLGHISKFFKVEQKCLTCGENSHAESHVCNRPSKCVNCSGAHRSFYKDCQEILKAKEISRIMAYDNVSFIQARRIFEGSNNFFTVPVRNQANFPELNTNISSSTRPRANIIQETCTIEAIKNQLKEIKAPKGANNLANEGTKVAMDQFAECLRNVPDLGSLWPRIWKCMSLHIQSIQPHNGSKP